MKPIAHMFACPLCFDVTCIWTGGVITERECKQVKFVGGLGVQWVRCGGILQKIDFETING